MHSSVSTCQFRNFEGRRVFQHTLPCWFHDFRRRGLFQHTPAHPFWDFQRGRLFQHIPAHISGFLTWSALQHTPGSSTSISHFQRTGLFNTCPFRGFRCSGVSTHPSTSILGVSTWGVVQACQFVIFDVVGLFNTLYCIDFAIFQCLQVC